jgi:hypothetical protein
MWLIGGWNPSDPVNFPRVTSNDVWSSPDGIQWTRVKPNTFTGNGDTLPSAFVGENPTDWRGRHLAGYVVFNDEMWIVGGDGEQGQYQNDVWHSVDGVHWTLAGYAPWLRRVLAYTLVFNNRIWVMGGQTVPQQVSPRPPPGSIYDERILRRHGAFYNDVWNTSDGVHWTRVVTQGPIWAARGMFSGSVVFQGKMWILGGGRVSIDGGEDTRFSDVWNSADGVHWTQVTKQVPWAPRIYHNVVVFDDRMWVIAGNYGNGEGNIADSWSSTDGVHWSQIANIPWPARHAASAWVYQGALFLAAGSAGSGPVDDPSNDVWKLDAIKSLAPAVLINIIQP